MNTTEYVLTAGSPAEVVAKINGLAAQYRKTHYLSSIHLFTVGEETKGNLVFTEHDKEVA